MMIDVDITLINLKFKCKGDSEENEIGVVQINGMVRQIVYRLSENEATIVKGIGIVQLRSFVVSCLWNRNMKFWSFVSFDYVKVSCTGNSDIESEVEVSCLWNRNSEFEFTCQGNRNSQEW
ncbi:hypothetical protein DPMN_066592 [Dreissena polymorpha]|uniref:Uncharacterized protein n=1 Tax=Dreissena polymorpha TaxID=45954 RepID=A0A9D4BS63_DREPO|nr:hypothetical protein DPMN_066592 [Dreissena polymorpha]